MSARPVVRTVAAALLTLLIATGCAGPAGDTAPPPPTGESVTAPAALTGTPPVGLEVPALGLDVDDLMALGLDEDGVVQVPPVEEPERVGWYARGVAPGDPGPAVLLAHVNGGGRPGAFAELSQLKPSDRIEVPRADGSTAAFTVDYVETVPKDEFPTRKVYGDTDGATLRLITCGGTWDPAAESYEDQVIAYATAV